MTITKEDAIKHMEAGGIISFEEFGLTYYRKIDNGKFFIRAENKDWREHNGLGSTPDFYTLLPIKYEEDLLPESVRNWVESVRINIEEQPSAIEAEILSFFDSKFPKPKPPTWWEVLARDLEIMAKNNTVHRGVFQIAADMVRERADPK